MSNIYSKSQLRCKKCKDEVNVKKYLFNIFRGQSNFCPCFSASLGTNVPMCNNCFNKGWIPFFNYEGEHDDGLHQVSIEGWDLVQRPYLYMLTTSVEMVLLK